MTVSISKQVDYVVLNIPTDGVSVSKKVDYVVIGPKIDSLLISKQIDYVILNTPDGVSVSKQINYVIIQPPIWSSPISVIRNIYNFWGEVDDEEYQNSRRILTARTTYSLPGVSVPIIGVSGSGSYGGFVANPGITSAGFGVGAAQALNAEIGGTISGVSATSSVSDPIPAIRLTDVFGTGYTNNFSFDIEFSISGVSGSADTNSAIPVAVIDPVYATGLIGTLDITDAFFITGVTGYGLTHTFFPKLISSQISREVLRDTQPPSMAVGQVLREGLLTDHLLNSSINVGSITRESLYSALTDVDSILQSSNSIRETILSTVGSTVNTTIKSSTIVREVLTENIETYIHASDLAREILISDGGKKFTPIIFVVT